MGTVSEFHKSFIKLAHLVEESEKNLISLFLAGLREDLLGKVKLDKPMTMVVAFRSVDAREMISLTDKKLAKFQFNKPSTHAIALHNSVTGKGGAGNISNKSPVKRLTPLQVDEYRKKGLCFRYGEPYTHGHHCKGKSLMLVECEEGNIEKETEGILLKPKTVKGGNEAELSIHAMVYGGKHFIQDHQVKWSHK